MPGSGRCIPQTYTRAPALFAAVVLAVTLTAAGCGRDQPQTITVVSWGGSYGRAVDEGAILPFTEATGIPVNVEDYNGGLAEIRAPGGHRQHPLGRGQPGDIRRGARL